MAGKLYTQSIGVKSVGFLMVDASAADLTALEGLMEGKVEKYERKSGGGTAAPMPAVLNTKKFSCGKKSQHYRCSFKVPHLKESKNANDVVAHVVGNFDANFDVSTSCDYCNVLLAK